MMAPTRIPGRVLVTGGGSGIGAAVAATLLARGSRVAVAGRRRERLEGVCGGHGDRAMPLPCDLADPAQRSGLLHRAADALGGLDGVVYAAGIASHQLPGAIGEDDLRLQLEVNLVAPLRLGEEALEVMGAGAFVYVASNLAHRPIATSAAYSASKAGFLAAMRSLAAAGAGQGLRFNAISPGIVDTEMTRALRVPPPASTPAAEVDAQVEAQLEGLRRFVPLGRLGTSEEVAEAILLLLSAPWITGADLVLDGGSLGAGG